MAGDWQDAIERAERCAPFLSSAMRRLPEITDLCARGAGEEALLAARELGRAEGEMEQTLRRERLGLALALGLGDLAGAFPLERVMAELSDFADRALDQAIDHVIRRRVPDAEPRGFTAIALGKQGAYELNYSSDIDPILLFDRQTLPLRGRDDPGEAAQRYARQVVELLSRQTQDGHVFRVDLRLRPASEVSPLAVSFAGALSHYESSALPWERAAFIRARSAAGDIEAGERFLDDIRPFVWRRSLDFTAIEEIRRLTARIREAYTGPRDPGPGFDVKRGRGGIREIEFFAQTHQLIYGGRLPSLRRKGTRAALDALASEGIISPDDAAMLGTAYDRLRVVEHRLQMVDDRQTHALPQNPATLDNVARLDGLADAAALVAELTLLCAAVAERYDGLLGTGRDDQRSLVVQAAPDGFDAEFTRRAARWRETARALRSGEARLAFDAIEPDLRAALAGAAEPQRAMVRWETMLNRLPSAVNLFRLFEQRPGLLEQVLRVLTLARPLADELSRRPELLDALIDTTALDLPGEVPDLAARMGRAEDGDYESQLDRIRYVVSEERFALGVQLVEARHDPLAIAEGLCRVAEAAFRTAVEAATREFAQTHGTIPGAELLVLGLGRFGGGALTHASDLDVVYLFTGEIGSESNGRRPLTASLYFNRLATRVTAAMSVPTAEGALYEIDTRLRPQGIQGPLAVSIESFARYQSEDAWTWEHMALARARPLIGPDEARAQLCEVINQVLARRRDKDELRHDVLKMRAEMALHKLPRGTLDSKLRRGGLVDCEFIVHYLQLHEGFALDPAVDVAIIMLIDAGFLPPDFGRHHATLIRILVSARLLAPDCEIPSGATGEALARACQEPDLDALLRSFAEARQAIARSWADLFGEQLEIER
jgi:glutamate-ammonia-ligase adenylyltransferase